jgi:tetratricopeptide (TPR) repeat protein
MLTGGERALGRIAFKISVGFVTGALVLLAVSFYLSNHYLKEQMRLAETGDLRGARAAVDRAARLDPFSPDPMAAEAYLGLRQGQMEAAAEAFREAIRREPVNHATYVALGDLQRQQLNDPEAAAESYREALSLNPHATAVVSRLAEALLSTGDLEGARDQYEWMRERGKIPLRELYTLGKIQTRLGEPGEAIATFEEAREEANAGSSEASEETQRKNFLQSLDLAIADALIVQGSYDQAREALLQSPAEQASAVLALLEEDPEGYRQQVLDAPVN